MGTIHMLNKKQKFVDAHERIYLYMHTVGDRMLCGTEMKALICIIRYCVYISFRFGCRLASREKTVNNHKCYEGVGWWECERKRHFQLIIRSIYTTVYIYVNVYTTHDVVLMLKTKYLFNKGCFPRCISSTQNRT